MSEAGVSHPATDWPNAAPQLPPSTSPLGGIAPLRFPRITRLQWYRVVALRHARGHHGQRLHSLLKQASLAANAAGRIYDVPALQHSYMVAEQVSRRTFWVRLATAMEIGWIRCVRRPAPGLPAAYELQLPRELIPSSLPEDLMQDLRAWHEDDAQEDAEDAEDAAYGRLTATAPTSGQHGPDTARRSPSDRLHTSPLLAKGSSPLCLDTSPSPGDNNANHTSQSNSSAPSLAELHEARQVLNRCRPWWLHQRGPGRSLTGGQATELAEAVAIALRRATPSQLIELMTVQTRSAKSLSHLVGYRLWQMIKTTPEFDRRLIPTPCETEEQFGPRYQAMIITRAAAQAQGYGPATATVRGQVRHTVEASAVRQAAASRSGIRPSAGQALREPEEVFAEQLANQRQRLLADPLEVYRSRAGLT